MRVDEKIGGMGISVARVRVALVAGAVLLVLVVAGFLGYARYRAHRFLAGLPGKLGIDIRRETNGYTYSQSVGGKTVMTLHAAKAVEHTDGNYTLHDVSMVLYGKGQDRQDRSDRISGAEFEYDPKAGVVRAAGEVHIDLQAPAKAVAREPAAPATEGEGARVIHVKTSGLVYLQKLGVAATDKHIEFRFGGMTGEALGAEYNSDTGMVVLQAAVKANGVQHGQPVVLTASHAELDRPGERALLTTAVYSAPGQRVRGDRATVHLRADGSPERIEAEGNVAVASATAGEMTAPRADVLLSAAGQAQSARFSGGVAYIDTSSLKETKGEAREAQFAFDAQGKPRTVVMTDAVRVRERARASAGAAWSEREASSAKMSFALAEGALREVEATGSAVVVLTEAGARSEMAGDVLRGRFTGAGKAAQLTDVQGNGHTVVHRVAADGAEETGTGETLDAVLRPGHGGGTGLAGALVKATQAGHVVLVSKAAKKAGGTTEPTVGRATAELAVYDGETDRLTLTGSGTVPPQVTSDAGTVSASRIVLSQATGDATAEGIVKATYVQAGAGEPVHVVADHAQLSKDAGRGVFFGGASPARLWQGASQVEAPVLELDQEQGTLTAHGAAGGGAPPVHAVLAGTATEGKPPAVARVSSRTMVYRDAAREVVFAGEVKVEDADGVLRAREATAYLQPASQQKAGAKAGVGGMFGGGIDHLVARGGVKLDQLGRRASGEQLTYTAASGLFVMTGTPAAPPAMIDEAQGTVTGQSLSFRSGDRSVAVAGGGPGHPERRVRTVTEVKPR